MQLVLPLLLFAALYFVVMPQRRRAQAQRSMVASLSPGDRVVTAGGMIGTLHSLDGERATVEIAPGVVIELLAPAVVRRLADDTSDDLSDDGSDDVSDNGPDAAPTPEPTETEPPTTEGPVDSTPPVTPRHEEN